MTHWMEGDWPAENPVTADTKALLAICRRIRDGEHSTETLELLEEAIEAVELHFEDNDPRSMGWVGDDGLP